MTHPALSFSINFDFRQDYYIMTKICNISTFFCSSAYFFVHHHIFFVHHHILEEVCVKTQQKHQIFIENVQSFHGRVHNYLG